MIAHQFVCLEIIVPVVENASTFGCAFVMHSGLAVYI